MSLVERRPRRLLERALVVGLGLVLFGAVLLWALPEILRRVALDQIPRHLGRAVVIEDVDLNVFTRRLRVTNLRLAERRGDQSFVEVERVEARFAPTALFRSNVRLTELVLVRPVGRLVRTEHGAFNVSDLLKLATDARAARSGRPPGRWSFTVDRLKIAGGALDARDQALAPPGEWAVRDLEVEAGPLTTRPGAAPGRGAAHARIDEATLDVTGEGLTLAPLAAVVRVALTGFELRRLDFYLARVGTPYRARGGRLDAALTATIDHEDGKLTKAALSGTVTGSPRRHSARTEHDDPFLEVSRADVTVKEADAITRSLTVSADVERIGFRARRDRRGVVDLADLLGPNARAAAVPDPAAPSPPAVPRRLIPVLRSLTKGFEQIRVERVTLGPSTLTLVDTAITPTTTLALTGMQASVTDLTWPAQGPAVLTLSGTLPGGGTLHVTGPVVPQPFEAELALHVRKAPIQPYQAYIPLPARFRGRFNGDSRQRLAQRDGTLVIASRGTGWAEDVEVRAPGARHPAIRIDYMDLVGVDVDWPSHARVARAGFRHPRVEVVREADGSFDLRRIFTPTPPPGRADAAVPPAASPRSGKPKGLLETMKLDVEEIRVEEGVARFLDRTTQPAFSKDLSHLTVAVDDLSNHPGERARLEAKSIVSGDSTLDIRGELGPIGSPPFIDLVGELGGLPLASLNPYAEPAIGWVITQGDLEYKMRFLLDGDTLDATNELVLGQLRVAPARGTDEVTARLGLPLSLIVALAKDRQGEIHANVPVAGSIRDPQFDLRETVWTAVRQSVGNLVRAPFRALGRAVRGGDTIEAPTVDPVTFAAGSSVIAPDMEKHLLRVADVLRRSPFVNLALAPALAPADVEALQAHALAARVRAFQDERGWPDGPGILVAYFTARFPGEEPPDTVEAQLALLRAREPAPDALLGELAQRRVDATRERLVSVEGIPAERLRADETKTDAAPLPADAAGRVELTVVAGDE